MFLTDQIRNDSMRRKMKIDFQFIYFFQVPFDFSIGEVFELLYKIHKIFQMKCDPNLGRLFDFMDVYIFKINDSVNDGKKKFKPTTTMQLLYDQLFEKN